MNPLKSPHPARPPAECDETVTFGEVDGHAVVRVETTYVLHDPDAVTEVLQWIEARRTRALPENGLLGTAVPRPEA